MQVWEWCLLSALLVLVLWTIWISLRVGISPMPTSKTVLHTWSGLLPDEVDGEILELGCGWGTLLKFLCQKYPKHSVTGLELSPLPWLVSYGRSRFWGHEDCEVVRRDFWRQEGQRAGLVVCYLYTGAMKQMAEGWTKTLPEGCYILSHTFAMPGWSPIKTAQAQDMYKTPVYLYQIGHSEPREGEE
jgi:hypothetical protein